MGCLMVARIKVPTRGGTQFWADLRYRDGWRVQEHVASGQHRLLDPNNRRHNSGSLDQCLAHLGELQLEASPPEIIVLLHGLGRNRNSLTKLSQGLENAGHRTIRLDYPSTRRSLDEHVTQVLQVLEHLEGARRVSFVTHSLGGIISRGVLANPEWPQNLTKGRVVMMAPPNQGAALARMFRDVMPGLFGAVTGPAGLQMADGVPYAEPAVPVMVIAGCPRQGRGLNPFLDGQDDGIVLVEETKLSSMTEHLTVDAIHTLIMNHPEAEAAAVRFLEPILDRSIT